MSNFNYAWAIDATTHDLVKLETPIPIPGPHQALVRLHFTTLNYRDIMIKAHSPAYPLTHKEHLIPCCDSTGIITSTGADSAFRVGDRIAIHPNSWLSFSPRDYDVRSTIGGGDVDGTLRHYMLVDDSRIHKLSDNTTLSDAAAAITAGGTAWQCLFEGPEDSQPAPGKVILTQGTGGVSMFAIQFASAAGATVIATSSSDEKLAIAKQLGATHTINYTAQPDWEKEVLRLTDGRGVDHVVEVAGTLVPSLAATRFAGLVSLVGLLAGSHPADLVPAVLFGAKTLRGVLGAASKPMIERMLRFMDDKGIRSYVGGTYEFEQAEEAFEALRLQKTVGKIAVRLVDDDA